MEKEIKKDQEIETAEVYSYHTFMFPFLYEMNKTTRKKFLKCCHPGWFADVWEPEKMNDPVYYNQYHYFNKAAHNAIYMKEKLEKIQHSDKEAVINLRFDLLSLTEENPKADSIREKNRPKNIGNPIKYVICKDDKKYSVDVNAIRMKLYNTGVGILIFELENRRYPTEKEVTEINDFGRRIYAPYYNVDESKKFKISIKNEKSERRNEEKKRPQKIKKKLICNVCAEKIYFEVSGKGVEQKKADLLPTKLRKSAEATILAEPIVRLLSNDEYWITTKEKGEKNEICIEPVIDDRMFVACYYKNGDFVDAMREWDGENYRYITDAKEKVSFDNKVNKNAANRLYTFMYVDGTGICCHSRNMLQNLLSDDHIYTRWLECGWLEGDRKVFAGTITGFSEYTMISVAKNPPEYVVTPFLTQYVEMAALVLAQRASLLSFEYMISECAKSEKNYKVESIQKKYTLFQSQILLKEVSPQQQGIEIYDMLEKNLMIEKEQAEIKGQIEDLFAQTNFEHDSRENKILSLLSILSFVEVIDIFVEILCSIINNVDIYRNQIKEANMPFVLKDLITQINAESFVVWKLMAMIAVIVVVIVLLRRKK